MENKVESVELKTVSPRIINWEDLKVKFFLSPIRGARKYLRTEKVFSDDELASGYINGKILNWEIEKKEWEQQALEVTMHNLRETKAIQMKNFLIEEEKIVSQLMNMTKIAMNNLVVKTKIKDPNNPGKTIDAVKVTDTKGFKQITDSTINILKYSRDRLGIPFEKEEEGLGNAVTFNFDLINLDEFEPDEVFKFFKDKTNERQNSPKQIETNDTDGISESSESSK
jgi:hypothetical protein